MFVDTEVSKYQSQGKWLLASHFLKVHFFSPWSIKERKQVGQQKDRNHLSQRNALDCKLKETKLQIMGVSSLLVLKPKLKLS